MILYEYFLSYVVPWFERFFVLFIYWDKYIAKGKLVVFQPTPNPKIIALGAKAVFILKMKMALATVKENLENEYINISIISGKQKRNERTPLFRLGS